MSNVHFKNVNWVFLIAYIQPEIILRNIWCLKGLFKMFAAHEVSHIESVKQFGYSCSDEGSDTAAKTSAFIIINYFYVGIQGYINIRIYRPTMMNSLSKSKNLLDMWTNVAVSCVSRPPVSCSAFPTDSLSTYIKTDIICMSNRNYIIMCAADNNILGQQGQPSSLKWRQWLHMFNLEWD